MWWTATNSPCERRRRGTPPLRVDATWIDTGRVAHRMTSDLNEPGLARILLDGED